MWDDLEDAGPNLEDADLDLGKPVWGEPECGEPELALLSPVAMASKVKSPEPPSEKRDGLVSLVYIEPKTTDIFRRVPKYENCHNKIL